MPEYVKVTTDTWCSGAPKSARISSRIFLSIIYGLRTRNDISVLA